MPVLSQLRYLLAIGGLLFSAPAPAETGEVPVDLELVLAVDISSSVDGYEARLQRDGYVQAILDARVMRAIKSGVLGRIAVTYVEWASYDYQRTAVDWTLIHDEMSAQAFALQVARASVITGRRTSISALIEYVAPQFEGNRFEGTRLVIDISGDGPNNHGTLVHYARDAAVTAGIVINGLPILNDRPNRFGFPIMKGLDLYYRECVIGGPGAFIVTAESFVDFADAIRSKLIMEIAGTTPATDRSPNLRHLAAAGDSAPCDAGERQWRQFQIWREPSG